MKRFLRLLCLFLILSLGIILLVFFGVSYYLSGEKFYKVPQDKTTLVMGHSHPACAFHDSIIPGVLNVSQNTEGYPYTYFKLEKILEANPHIKNVLVEFTNNQVSHYSIERVSGQYMRINLARNFPVMPLRFIAGIMKGNGNPSDWLDALKSGFVTNFGFILSESESFIDYAWRDFRAPDHVFRPSDSLSESDPDVFNDVYSVDWTNLNYLMKIRSLAKRKNIRLFFVRSPLPVASERKNDLVFNAVREDQFNGVPFLDFAEFPLPNGFFADAQHLNVRGQAVFSCYFSDLVTKGLLESDDPHGLISSHPFNSNSSSCLPENHQVQN